jgi:hypothetical protein
MIADMNILLNMQQDLFDNIEKSVERSAAYIFKGTKNVRDARKRHRRCIIC